MEAVTRGSSVGLMSRSDGLRLLAFRQILNGLLQFLNLPLEPFDAVVATIWTTTAIRPTITIRSAPFVIARSISPVGCAMLAAMPERGPMSMPVKSAVHCESRMSVKSAEVMAAVRKESRPRFVELAHRALEFVE